MTRPGWTTFPILPIRSDGSCACGDPKCKDAGKHPAVKWGRRSLLAGQQLPIPKGHGIGLATGARSGVVVLDIDAKDDKQGFESLEKLRGSESLPDTLMAITPSGGAHIYFAYPHTEIRNSAGVLGDGVDVRGDGGYVVIPPSPHKRGGNYEWSNPEAIIAPIPDWLLHAILNPPVAPSKLTRAELAEVAQKWKRARSPQRKELGDALLSVAKGEAFADEGKRDTTLFRLCEALAPLYPNADASALSDLFAPSLFMMPGGPSPEDVEEKFSRLVDEIPQWHNRLATSEVGSIKPCLGNTVVVLENHEAWRGKLAMNERELKPVFLGVPPSGGDAGPITDADATHVAKWFTTEMRMSISNGMAHEALIAVAKANGFDPFREYLDGLHWDGVARLDTWLTTYGNVADSPYVRAVAAAWAVSVVARTMDPGCKVDTMLILESPKQGLYKSTLLEAFVGVEFFCDHLPDITNKDALLQLHGPAVIEVAELSTFGRREAEAVKSFLSRRNDRFRVPYGRSTEVFPRRVVFAGTTNEENYFTDGTGNRRFWPVRVGARCRVEELRRDRDQLLAEAVVRYRAGAQWWLTTEQEILAEPEQDARTIVHDDAWLDLLETKLRGRTETTIAAALELLCIPEGQWNRGTQIRVGLVLRVLGFRLGGRKRVGSTTRTRVYSRPVELSVGAAQVN